MTEACLKRLRKEYLRLLKEPVPLVQAVPLESNILEWHYCVEGAPDTSYQGGRYHGKIVFPPEYPYKPPSIYMITPNGRFKVNTRLCLSISDFHPEEWSCLWSVGTIISGLLSFMNDTQRSYGTIETSDREKRRLARESMEFNLKDPLFCKLFPSIVTDYQENKDKFFPPEPEASIAGNSVGESFRNHIDQAIVLAIIAFLVYLVL
jgi:ubiquitin-conjugating enzyme E2 J2